MIMSKTNEGSKTILLVDIAHNSVGVGVLVVAPNIAPRLLSVWRETFESTDLVIERVFQTTLRITRKLIEKANAAGYGAWDDVYCSVGSPWVLTHVRTARYARDKQFVVTEKLLNQLVQADQDKFFARAGFGTVPFSNHATILDYDRIATRVNGHTMNNPVGQRARDVECSYLVSGMDSEHIAALRSALYVVGHREPIIHAVQRSQLRAIQTLQGAKNYALIDFHGGITECSVVRDGVLTVTASTPVSEESYLNDLAHILNKSKREIVSIINMHSRALLDTSTATQLGKAHDQLIERYTRNFRELLVTVAQHGLIPNQVFFVADHSMQFFDKLLLSNEYAPLTVVHGTLRPTPLSASLFGHAIDARAVEVSDTPLVIAALAYSSNHS